MKKSVFIFFALYLFTYVSISFAQTHNFKGNTIFTAVREILFSPESFSEHFVTVKGIFQGFQKDISHSSKGPSWFLRGDEGFTITCCGELPELFKSNNQQGIGLGLTILGNVSISEDGVPLISVIESSLLGKKTEYMVSVLQILLDPIGMKNRRVGLLGVLAKGYDSHGMRMYFLADPTGAITLDRLPKLYPKGTILRLNGVVKQDENGLPSLGDIEILSAKD